MSAPISRPSGRFFFCSLGLNDLDFYRVIDVEGSAAAFAVEESESISPTPPSNDGDDSDEDLFGDREFSAAVAAGYRPPTPTLSSLPVTALLDDEEDLFGDREFAAAVAAGYRPPTPVLPSLPVTAVIDDEEDLFGDREFSAAIAAGYRPPTPIACLKAPSPPTAPCNTDKLSRASHLAKDASAERSVAPAPATGLRDKVLGAAFPDTATDKAKAGRVRKATAVETCPLAETQARRATVISAPVSAHQPAPFPAPGNTPLFNPLLPIAWPGLFLPPRNSYLKSPSYLKFPSPISSVWPPSPGSPPFIPDGVPRRHTPSHPPWAPLPSPPCSMEEVKAPRSPVAAWEPHTTVPRVPVPLPIPTSGPTTTVRAPPRPPVAARQPSSPALPAPVSVGPPRSNLPPPSSRARPPFPTPKTTAANTRSRPPSTTRYRPPTIASPPARKARHPALVSPSITQPRAKAREPPRHTPAAAQQPPSVVVAPARFPAATLTSEEPPPRPASASPSPRPPFPAPTRKRRASTVARELTPRSVSPVDAAALWERGAKRQATLQKVRSGGVEVVYLDD